MGSRSTVPQSDNLFVAGFLGAPRMNFFLITVDDVKGQIATVSAPGLAPIAVELAAGTTVQKGAALTLGVRPESVAVCDTASKAATICGQVRLVEHLGRETILYVDAGPLQCVSSESGTGNITVQVGLLRCRRRRRDQLNVIRDIYLFSRATSGRSRFIN